MRHRVGSIAFVSNQDIVPSSSETPVESSLKGAHNSWTSFSLFAAGNVFRHMMRSFRRPALPGANLCCGKALWQMREKDSAWDSVSVDFCHARVTCSGQNGEDWPAIPEHTNTVKGVP